MKICDDKKQYEAEKHFFLQYKHDHIVDLRRHCDQLMVILLPYMPHTLHVLIERLDWEDTLKVLKQSAKALDFIHQKGYIHMDFKPENVLLDQEMNVKLCDLGASVPVNEKATAGTLEYCAPEVKEKGTRAMPELDVYSYGLVMIQLLKKCSNPEAKEIVRRSIGKTQTGKYESLVHQSLQNSGCTKESAAKITRLAHRCTMQNPGGRAKIAEIIDTLENL